MLSDDCKALAASVRLSNLEAIEMAAITKKLVALTEMQLARNQRWRKRLSKVRILEQQRER
jgi:hypothetical protein